MPSVLAANQQAGSQRARACLSVEARHWPIMLHDVACHGAHSACVRRHRLGARVLLWPTEQSQRPRPPDCASYSSCIAQLLLASRGVASISMWAGGRRAWLQQRQWGLSMDPGERLGLGRRYVRLQRPCGARVRTWTAAPLRRYTKLIFGGVLVASMCRQPLLMHGRFREGVLVSYLPPSVARIVGFAQLGGVGGAGAWANPQ